MFFCVPGSCKVQQEWGSEESYTNATDWLVVLPSCRRSHWYGSHVTRFFGLHPLLDCCCWYQVQWDRSLCRKPWDPWHSWKPWSARQRWERWYQRRSWTSRYCMGEPILSSGTGTCFLGDRLSGALSEGTFLESLSWSMCLQSSCGWTSESPAC